MGTLLSFDKVSTNRSVTQFFDHLRVINWKLAQGSESTHNGSSSLYMPRSALGTFESEFILHNTKDDGSVLKNRSDIIIAVDTESMIQQACGHPICLSV